MDILKTLFFLFIFSFPIAEVGKLRFNNGISVSVNDILLIVLIFTWVFFEFKNAKSKRYFLKKPIIIFITICLFSLFFNFFNLTLSNFIISFLYLFRYISYISLYFVVKNFDLSTKNKTSIILLISGFFTVLIGYIQFFFYPSLKNLFYLGWDEHLYRMFSSFLDPNFAGGFFALYFIFTLIFIKEYYNKKYFKKTVFISILSIFTLIAIYLTYSRSALIMLAVSLITFLVLIDKKRFVIVSVLFLILMIFISPKSFKTEGTNLSRTVSSEARITSVKQGLLIFEKSPVLGVGFNAYRYAQNKYLGLNNKYWQITHSGAGTDNSFVFVLATTGIIGFIAYIYLLYRIFKVAKQNIKKNKYAVSLFSSLLGLIFGSMFINSLFYVFILEWLIIQVGLTENS